MAPQQPKLIILAGPNGSGKTTFAQLLQQDAWGEHCRFLNADAAAEALGSWNDPNCIAHAQQMVREQLSLALHNREDIMYETVFSHPSKVELVRRALELGYFIRLFFICTESPRINLERVADRFLSGGHTVPGDKVMSRYNRALLYGAEAMRLVQRGYLYDNTSSALAGKSAFRLIFRTIDGQENKLYIPPEDMPPAYRYFWEDYLQA
ncbi:MAG: zeta toxin family protein [Akkermansia sp.]|nr:zeta toxin family protein [Akkermansia sp.]